MLRTGEDQAILGFGALAPTASSPISAKRSTFWTRGSRRRSLGTVSETSLGAERTLALHQLNRWSVSDDDFVEVRRAFLEQPKGDRSAET